jgi:transcriptional regulator with GAF, ATPase, and Fis domain
VTLEKAEMPRATPGAQNMKIVSRLIFDGAERNHILNVMKERGDVVTTGAIRLGFHRTNLIAIMQKLSFS